ncbi:MAG: DinB family protein [Acidobacteriia bacterium]|nr:DinB family protein [Terriglobia bacterium]
MSRIAIVLLLLVMLVAGGWAQEANPVVSAARKQILPRARHMVEAAQEMPADKYGFKATEGQMSFGQIVRHTAWANGLLCSIAAGEKAPPEDFKDTDPKDKLVAALAASVSYCEGVLAKLDDKNLGQQLKVPWGPMTRAEILFEMNADQGNHYSMLASYLRLNGLLPPTAKKKK